MKDSFNHPVNTMLLNSIPSEETLSSGQDSNEQDLGFYDSPSDRLTALFDGIPFEKARHFTACKIRDKTIKARMYKQGNPKIIPVGLFVKVDNLPSNSISR